jgi:hypothetical protein
MRLKFLPAVWIGFVLFAAPAHPQAEPADLTGTIRDVKFDLPAITFTFLEGQNAKWKCTGGTPDDMDAGGWHKNDMRGAGTVKIQPIQIKEGQISVQSVKTKAGRTLLPKPPIKKAAPAVECTREPSPAK